MQHPKLNIIFEGGQWTGGPPGTVGGGKSWGF